MSSRSEVADLAREIREQLLYMRELGVTALDAPSRSVADEGLAKGVVNGAEPKVDFVPPPAVQIPVAAARPAPTRAAGSRLSELPSLTQRKAAQFFDKYNPPEPDSARSRPETSPLIEIAPSLPDPAETIDQIRAEITLDCRRCKLCELGRTQVVNSVGNFNADLMFVGEAPGADEDRLGEPFVGRAGQLLTDIIKAIGLSRSEVFIGNINRCRPPGNRTPEPDEAVVCKPFLLREIAVVRPKVIVVLGAHAAQTLLETKTPISKMRGRFHDYVGVKVMPTFHPAYLLRDPNKKRDVWEDMKKVRDLINSETVSEKVEE